LSPFSEPGSIGGKIQLWAALNFRAMPNTILGSEGKKKSASGQAVNISPSRQLKAHYRTHYLARH